MTYVLTEYPDRELLAMDLANQISSELRSQLASHERVSMAVPGGTSPGPVFDALCGVDLDWARVSVMLTDERWVPEDSPRSNTALVRRRLLVERAEAARLLPLYRAGAEADSAVPILATAIERELPLGVALLGMGTDGHTASLFPGADRLAEALSPSAPVLLPVRAPGAPELRVTLSARVLDGALSKHVLIFGDDKLATLEAARGQSREEAPINAILDGATVHWAA
jgi:6-phosphogluconolactonase